VQRKYNQKSKRNHAQYQRSQDDKNITGKTDKVSGAELDLRERAVQEWLLKIVRVNYHHCAVSP
jgi:hypothetical protein